MPLTWRLRCALVAMVACGCLSAAFGAEAPATTSSEPAPQEPVVIGAASIPDQADQDERFALEVVARTQPFDADAALAARLSGILNGIHALASSYQPRDLTELTAPRLNSLEKYWRLYEDRLRRWQVRVQTQTSRYSSDAAELARRREAWEATLAARSSTDLPSALSNRVNEILEQLKQAQATISIPLEAAIEMGRRGNHASLELDAGSKEVKAAIATYTRRLGQVDMPPLWDAAVQHAPVDGAVSDAEVMGISIELRFLREYLQEQRYVILIYGVVWLGSLLLFMAFTRRKHRADPAMAERDQVLARPFSGWLLLGALCVPIVFRHAPIALNQAAMLISLIPVMRLLPAKVFRPLRWLPYTIVVLFIAHRVRVMFWSDSLYYRLHLLLITVIAAVLVIWLLQSTINRPTMAPGRRRILLRMLGWLSVMALFASAIANCIGNVSLAEMLSVGVIESAYIGLAIYAAVVALISIGGLLLADPQDGENGFISRNLVPLRAGLRTALILGGVALWVVVAVNKFQVYRPTAEWLRAVLTDPISLGELDITPGSVLLFAFAVWLSVWVSRAVRVLLQNEVLSNMKLPPGVGNSISSLTYYFMVIAGFFMALAAAGFQVSQLTLVFGALGVGIGLGLQNIVGNFVSGLILMFERPIRPGDVIEVGTTVGRVREIGMRATKVQTFEGADVVVPNGTMVSENLINWTLSNTNRRVDLDVGVSYSADPPTVQTLLLEVARSIDGISSTPAPMVLFLRFNSSSLDFGIRAWTNDFDNWRSVQSALGIAVHRALKEAGIEIPFPQQDLHLRSVAERVNLPSMAQATLSEDSGGAGAGESSQERKQ